MLYSAVFVEYVESFSSSTVIDSCFVTTQNTEMLRKQYYSSNNEVIFRNAILFYKIHILQRLRTYV